MAKELGSSFDIATVVRELHAELQALQDRVAALEAGQQPASAPAKPASKPAGSKPAAPAE